MAIHQRKRIRLTPEQYRQVGAICSVTLAVRERRLVFADPAVAEATVGILKDLADKTGVIVYGYCVMPDHVHLVLGPSEGCDIVTFVGQFKNLAQRAAWTLGVRGPFWQQSFWDHFLRQDEDLEAALCYVLQNPERAGLIQDWRRYPFSGSLHREV